MHTQNLATAYERKTDEELLQLAEQKAQLTPEAQAVLENELGKRRIGGVTVWRVSETDDQTKVGQIDVNRPLLIAHADGIHEFVTKVLHVYRSHFWLFLKLVAPAVIVGYIAVLVGHAEGRQIAHHLLGGPDKTTILEIWGVNFLAGLVSWMAFSSSFAAICFANGQITAGFLHSPSDCFAEVRRRVGTFARLSLLLFFLCLVAAGAGGVLGTAILWLIRQRQSHISSFVTLVISFGSGGLFLLLLSRFGLAMPAVILDDCKVGQAMFRSDELSTGKWITLAVLLSKSLIGGYLAGMAPYWLAGWIWGYVQLPLWALRIASITGVVVVEPFMFIGFALLYSRMSTMSSHPSNVPLRQFV